MKLAKRVTGRSQFVSFTHSYHGSTQGALSLMGGEYYKAAYRPLLPGMHHCAYNSDEVFALLTHQVAAVFVEPVQAESGVNAATHTWLKQLREHCTRMGILLVFDEIQSGFGRTGRLWAFEHSGVVPDVLLLGKALGAGMPLGAFISSGHHMQQLTHSPVLGHITTFGGHPVSCAAGLAGLQCMLNEDMLQNAKAVAAVFTEWMGKYLPGMPYSQCGLWASWHRPDFETNYAHIQRCWEAGIITDWFLFAPNKLRIAPPLTITAHALEQVLHTLRSLL